MRRKEANLYSVPSTLENAPYLTQDQLMEFQSQFVLFDQEVDLKKLKQSFSNLNTSGNQNYRPVQLFVSTILDKKQKCTFAEYINQMGEFFEKQDKGELIMQMLSDNKKDISPQILKEMLEGTLGREVTNKELFEILGKVFEVEEGTGVNKEQIGAVLQRGSKGGVTRDHSRENRERQRQFKQAKDNREREYRQKDKQKRDREKEYYR